MGLRLVIAFASASLVFGVVAAPALADPPSVTVTTPADFSFARQTIDVTGSISGGTAPYTSAQLDIDGIANAAPVTISGSSFDATLDTTSISDGIHTLDVSVTDSAAQTATSGLVNITVDNTPPLTSIVSPAPNQFFEGSLAVDADSSDAYGVQSVQFYVDGVATGSADTSPSTTGGFDYTTTLDISGLTATTHTLTEVTTDNAGNTTTSAGVPFTVGAGPSVAITSPANFAFTSGTEGVTATVTPSAGSAAPYQVQLFLQSGTAAATQVGPTQSGDAGTFTLPWDTTTTADGPYTLTVEVTDANDVSATSGPVKVTVANTLPQAIMYAPLPMPGYGYEVANGPTTFQVQASSTVGIASVQFTIDGSPDGIAPITTPDTAGGYVYSLPNYDTSSLTPGMHEIGATATDNDGRTTTATPVEIDVDPSNVYVPVLNFHGIEGPLDIDPDTTDQTAAEATADLSYLQQNNYQSITLEQYETWIQTGQIPALAAGKKPVLITIDDGLTDEEAWDPLLQQYGFNAVLFVVTGFTDGITPGDDSDAMPWSEIQSLAANGRWEIAFHAGAYGHGSYDPADDSDPSDTQWTVGGETFSYPSTCWTYYTCLSNVTTTKGGVTTTVQETPAEFEAQISADVENGVAELKAEVPTMSPLAWACPWNACGQWTNQYNDTSGTVQSWLPAFAASQFPIVFTQTDPVAYGQAAGNVGALDAYNRHYRFEVDTDTTTEQFAAALTDPSFAYYPLPGGTTTTTTTTTTTSPAGGGGGGGGGAVAQVVAAPGGVEGNAGSPPAGATQSRFVAAVPTPTILKAPTIGGKAKVGSYLRVTNMGRWESSTKLTTAVLAWQRCNTGGRSCKSMPGFRKKSYLVRRADIGHRLRVLITARDKAGHATAASKATAVIPNPARLVESTRHSG